ncbi:prostate androgen-regulated mucin-like protein 1 [Anolis carolinensis]|uniref:Prostate androgen-regulated mucin-like protein 1 n=1 Tax=Anolis carolinensis TaxID=28377 RepID=R4GB15_ANOCA|nr:PREDICTED: prostate androgen-regulated mucin-like protein 1 [Anolis carolinensis]|eukprot:XP_003222414.2 PREDICTED: prostate androgen-regulated mucin-like protein 1 [Anolis carolinensis]
MARDGSPALIALVAITAGLNICCALIAAPDSSMASHISRSTTERIESDHTVTMFHNNSFASTSPPAAPSTTLSLSTTLGDSEHATTTGNTTALSTVEISATTPLLNTSDMNISAATQPNTLSPVTSFPNATTETFTHSQTPAFTSPQSSNDSVNITAPSDITKLSTAEVTQLSSTETPVPVSTSKKVHTVEATSRETHVISTSSSPLESFTSSETTLPSKVSLETSPTGSTTFSSGITIQEVQRALSPGSIAAITITVIAVVLLVFGIAAFLKIRHSSYGRLFDDHDYGSWGNYNNPLYDDS